MINSQVYHECPGIWPIHKPITSAQDYDQFFDQFTSLSQVHRSMTSSQVYHECTCLWPVHKSIMNAQVYDQFTSLSEVHRSTTSSQVHHKFTGLRPVHKSTTSAQVYDQFTSLSQVHRSMTSSQVHDEPACPKWSSCPMMWWIHGFTAMKSLAYDWAQHAVYNGLTTCL